MPRSIYGAPQITYIGETVQSNGTDVAAPIDWKKINVWNRISHKNVWWLLNAGALQVDYGFEEVSYNSLWINIVEEDNPLFQGVFTLSYKDITAGGSAKIVSLPDDTDRYKVTGLTANHIYEFNLITQLSYGGLSDPSKKQVKTAVEPIPKTPVLTKVGMTNDYIDLSWTVPAGSTATYHSIVVMPPSGLSTWIDVPTGNTLRVPLRHDTKYQFQAIAWNKSRYENDAFRSPGSNTLQWATGHANAWTSGSMRGGELVPWEGGSWRPDIGWKYHGDTRTYNDKIQMGYWQADPRTTGTTYGIVRPEEEIGRYRGCVTYDWQRFRREVGANICDAMNVTQVCIRRVYRYRYHGAHWPPEPAAANYMLWHLTNTDVYNSGGPPIIGEHRNNYNSADAVAGHDTLNSGSYHDWLRLPRVFGKALITGNYYGTGVNGVMLYRGDHQNSGSGAAGYGAWARHGAAEYLSGWVHPDRHSNWTIFIWGDYTIQTASYVAPYPW